VSSDKDLAFCIGNILINTEFATLKYFLKLGLLASLVQMLNSGELTILRVGLTAMRKVLG
jgi:hypothetical protein